MKKAGGMNKKLTGAAGNKMKNGKAKTKKYITVNDAYYNELIEKCIIISSADIKFETNTKKKK